MDPSPKRRRFRFYLSTAFIAMLVAAGALGIYIRNYYLDDELRRPLRVALDRKYWADFNDEELSSVALKFPIYGTTHIFIAPELAKSNPKITYKRSDSSLRQVLFEVCCQTNAEWDIFYGAILIYPKGKRPVLQEIPQSKDLSRDVIVCWIDSPLSGCARHAGELALANVVIDSRLKNPDEPISMITKTRLDYTLTWMCYLAGAEWKFVKNASGQDEILIVPAGMK